MNTKTTGIVATVITSLCCGIPGLGLICIAALAALGTQMPEVMQESGTTIQETILGVIMFVCGGIVLIAIPIIVGFFALRGRSSDMPEPFKYDEPIPPAS